ncbi:MAG: hypothetical protein WC758_03580 [Candidatus Woesearchaeota archaeon]
MNIDYWTKTNQIRPRQLDKPRIKSLIQAAEINAKLVQKIELTDESASLIYREMYESIRQLGDAALWLQGYEPLNHEVSMEILKSREIKNKILLNHLSRFKSTRHDINYRGFKASKEQGEEIINFWKKCGLEIIEQIKKELNI